LPSDLRITLKPITAQQLKIARGASRRIGKAHHQAAINFGDCCSDTLSKATREPLLFQGDDFGQTDIVTGS